MICRRLERCIRTHSSSILSESMFTCFLMCSISSNSRSLERELGDIPVPSTSPQKKQAEVFEEERDSNYQCTLLDISIWELICKRYRILRSGKHKYGTQRDCDTSTDFNISTVPFGKSCATRQVRLFCISELIHPRHTESWSRIPRWRNLMILSNHTEESLLSLVIAWISDRYLSPSI